MITGEERLREFLTDLYGSVVFYDGRPTQDQVKRADALSRELADVVTEFDAWVAREMPGINQALVAKSLPAIALLTRAEWEKQGEDAD